ncbi:MAG: DUF6174 domain-containing protein [Bacteroidetes bacterium]|nr:DUF6174 domain-containing protein [Bacteroidota bacterium]
MKLKYLIGLFLMFSNGIVSCEKEAKEETPEDSGVWRDYDFKNYDYTFQIDCFCSEEYREPKRIEVRDNKVFTVAGTLIGEVENPTVFRTIDGLFEFIEEQSKLNPAVEEIEYDPTYGFPTSIFFDISELIADEEIRYSISDFKAY